MVKAIGLFSGGLDSILAARLLQEQGIDVEVLIFGSYFFNQSGDCFAVKVAEKNNVPYKFIDLGEEYHEMVKNPEHGYGKNLNPCIDCKIFMLRKAKEYAEKNGADFVFTGEVLGQRPKSQHKGALITIEEEADLKGKLLRPLSAKWLQETEPEKKGLVDREKLLKINGRQRKKQLALAEKYGIKDFSTPAGGCLLTEPGYCNKLKDIIDNKQDDDNNIKLLRLGRHFRKGKAKIIVGKNQEDNENILSLKKEGDLIFEVEDVPGPTTILRGDNSEDIIKIAAQITARYSKAKKYPVNVKYGDKSLEVKKISEEEIEELRI